MISGWWDPATDRPLINVRVAITNQLVDQVMPFVVDTGAEVATLSAHGAASLGIDLSGLATPELFRGIGGYVAAHYAPAAIIFEDADGRLSAYYVEIAILADELEIASDNTPSRLGRDVLDRVRMVYHHSGDRLLIDPLDPDAVA